MTPRARFVAVQLTKAGLGALLGTGLLLMAGGHPSLSVIVAIGGLVAPALLAGLGLTRMRLAALEQAALFLFAGLIAYLAALTGGVTSPLLIWFALVPAEAALAGSRPDVIKAAGAAVVALIVLLGADALHLLPQFPFPGWPFYGASVALAVVQAAAVAAAAQERQRAADRALAEGEAMYRLLADNVMDLITRHDSGGRILFASPAALPLLGVSPESLTGVGAPSLCHPDDARALQKALTDAGYFGRPASAEVRLKKAGGAYIWAEIRCRPVPKANGTEIVAVTRDISERKAYERQLIEARDLSEEANRAKSRFLANMSHELRTPLNAIIGFSEVMVHEMFGPVGQPRYQEYSRLIHESGNHLLELINGILDMSKIESGKFTLSEEVFDLAAVADASVRFVKLVAERSGVVLKTQVAPDAAAIFADKRATKQILVNLLSNGVKFTPKGGEVTVYAARVGDGIEIAVADTGVGIPEKDLERLGQPFEQVEGEHVRKKEGTGLGLSLVKALAAMHGGEAVLESTLGVGTTVRVRLPHAAVEANGDHAEPDETRIAAA